MKFLSKQQILMLHSALLTQSGCLDGIRDDDLITAILSVASGTMDYAGLLRWLQSHLA